MERVICEHNRVKRYGNERIKSKLVTSLDVIICLLPNAMLCDTPACRYADAHQEHEDMNRKIS